MCFSFVFYVIFIPPSPSLSLSLFFFLNFTNQLHLWAFSYEVLLHVPLIVLNYGYTLI